MINCAGIALVCGLAALGLVACQKPCAVTTDCSAGEVCAAAVCKALACEEAMLARDPATGTCVALSGCFLTAEQKTWQTCQDDPCGGLAEGSCLADQRCQPTYASPDVQSNPLGASSKTTCTGSGGFAGADATAPGVNNGDQPKHGGFGSGCLVVSQSREYAGCRAMPQITPQAHCNTLTSAQCAERSDCTPAVGLRCSATDSCEDDSGSGQVCADLYPIALTNCRASDQTTCLLNPACQPVGTRCYCPSGASCACSGGMFLGCENNDHLRRCASASDCNADERCDNDEDCITPRTFASPPAKPAGPGAPSCLGACVPTGCAGLGEDPCNANPACDAGHYQTVCHLAYYSSDVAPDCTFELAVPGSCGCGNQYAGCADQSALPERSLLVRDPEIVDDPTFSLESVLTQLAPAGQVDAFAGSLLTQVMGSLKLANGATATSRAGFALLYDKLDAALPLLAHRFSALMATTALINRLDLATTKDCGEARISFAMTSAYTNGNQRMTVIVELKVPDDGSGCKLVAQRWAELALVDDVAQRRAKLIALYGELLKPANLGQIRTNEFVNLTNRESWELREFHLKPADGLLEQSSVAQTVDPLQAGTTELRSWASANAAALKAGTVIIPPQFLAAASTEDGARLTLSDGTGDPALQEVEKSVNALACAGCHLTETLSPFVHIGERLGQKVGDTYRPSGRAVIDNFLKQELVKRGALLTQVLSGSRGLSTLEWRPIVQARVH